MSPIQSLKYARVAKKLMKLKRQVVLKVKEGGYFWIFIFCLPGPIHSLVIALLLDFLEIRKKTALLLIFQSSGLNIQGALVPIF